MIAPGITVNGHHISADEINAEVQYHPAPSLIDAKCASMQALVLRSLLLQEAEKSNINGENEDQKIENLLSFAIPRRDIDDDTCRTYYDTHLDKFQTSPLWEVSHILFAASPDHKNAYEKAKQNAVAVLDAIQENPSCFSEMAKAHSSCPSSENGGHLGQITKGQTTPLFEQALSLMSSGDLSYHPIATEVGYHLIKVHNRAEERQVPYDFVKDWITDHFSEQTWNADFKAYVINLANNAQISGFRFIQPDPTTQTAPIKST